MLPSHDPLLFPDALSPAQQEALQAACAADPALAEAFEHWQAVRAAVGKNLEAHLPDRSLFICYALDATGHGDVLAEEERAALATARPALDRALRAHPALADIFDDVDRACADFDAAWSEHLEPARHPAPDRRAARPRRRAGLRWGWRVLAGVAVVAFVAVSVLVMQRDRSRITITVDEGTTRIVQLADGSTVRLLSGATLSYRDPAKTNVFNRRVTLSGDAFFDIAPGQTGFTVETPTALATVLGTSFGIRAGEASMEVVLATGRLAVASKAAQEQLIVLEPGQMSRVALGALPVTPSPVDLSEALAWTGLLLFRAAPLEEVATRLREQYQVALAIDPALADERVTGTFRPEEGAAQILATLATTLDARLEGTAADGFRLLPATQP